jgi:hypothetical protein
MMPGRSPRPWGHCDAIDFGAGGGVLDYQIAPLPEPAYLFLISHGCCLRRVGQIFNQSLVQEVEELFDLSEWSLATLADIDEPIAVALQRSPP